jgi:hypothetical protein
LQPTIGERVGDVAYGGVNHRTERRLDPVECAFARDVPVVVEAAHAHAVTLLAQ